ncbi:hypothetical protein Palpr_0529 [Paludibacter propionicigenes WB4]|uniref:Uncharacterized protein n=2 Tax=Paludibacter TaxID=346096 RepID=E4T1U4_PALPW|nr:hypothetical protein Palpr_0529 [Paludibacter propionicigenes WB4]
MTAFIVLIVIIYYFCNLKRILLINSIINNIFDIMKIKTTLLITCLFVTICACGQIQDLAKLANGKIVYNSTLYDSNENLYGYLYIYERDADSQNKTMEYVFLDRNLNKVSNKEFTSKQYNNVLSGYYDCTLMGDYVIMNKIYYYRNSFTGISKLLLSTFQTISLKDNTVSAEFKYENNQFTEFISDYDQMKKEYKGLETRNYVRGFNNGIFKGFFITEDNNKKSYLEKDVQLFNEKKELLWKYEYNPNGTEKQYNSFNFLHVNKNTIYVAISNWTKGDFGGVMNINEYAIVALDLQSGKEKYKYVLERVGSEYSHTLRVKEIDNKLYITGNYSPYKKTDFTLDQNLGFYKIVLNENGNEIEKKYTQWSDFTNQIEVDERGRMEKNFRLRPIKYFFFKDGSISILTEKYKFDAFWTGLPKTTDYVLFNMKTDFTPGEVNTIKKELSHYSAEFLFSQYIKDQTGVVFFYYDVVKDPNASLFNNTPNLLLGINTIINGKLTEEKIPLTAKKKYSIYPQPAKEGYIMLREYNEKDKYNQIRLEKLNY